MIFNMNGGGGGGGSAALNFKVVGGTSAPSNPKENTIWVNTSTTITSWIFSATEPETPAEGMVWLSTGTSSTVEFNALKENGIQVYPQSVKQYVSSTWVDVEAKSYQGGIWVDWSFYLFKEGSGQLVDLTIGNESNWGITTTDDYVEFTDVNRQSWIRTTNTIDISSYSTLCCEVTATYLSSATGQIYQAGLRVAKQAWTTANSITTDNYGSGYAALGHFSLSEDRTVYRLDIEALSGEYYVGISGGYAGTVYNLWLE